MTVKGMSLPLCLALLFLALPMVASPFFIAPAGAFSGVVPKIRVLVLNSYHEGYRWTDDIVEGVSSVLGPEAGRIQMDVEYMDAKRNTDPAYLYHLYELYRYKFKDSGYDLVLCSDDRAFSFLKEHHDELFPDTPVVFCGLNHFEDGMLAGEELFTGIVEGFDVGATLAVMLKLHPDCRRIYVVNDDTATGRSIATELKKVIPAVRGVEFTVLSDVSMEEVQARVNDLPDDSLVLFLVFFRDAAGQYYAYDESIEKVSSSSAVPVYGLWDFNLGHGIVGGMLTSGYDQGRMAAELSMRVLEGENPSHIPVARGRSDVFGFDDAQMRRFGIDHGDLPGNSKIVNEVFSERKRLLVLHSYDPHMTWVRNLNAGILSVLNGREDIETVHDYMDLKRHPELVFAQRLTGLLREKFEGSRFDAILSCDDAAYHFLLAYGENLFPGTPVAFCGVNDFAPSQLEGHPFFTGLVEAIDVKQTLDLALKLHPRLRRVVVINDLTDVGKANRKMVDSLKERYRDRVEFVFFEDMNMSEVREKVGSLTGDSIVLLLTFTRDRSRNVFSYEESIGLIAEKASVPIYGIWDFYLGHGLLGGMMTSGFSQGETAARMAVEILDGKPLSDIPVLMESPNRYMFDEEQLRRFGITARDLPAQSIIINSPESFYSQHRLLVWLTGLVVTSLAAGVVVLGVNIRRRKMVEAELQHYAMTDGMTGVLNRRTGLLILEQQMGQAGRQGKTLCVCFADLNNLKEVNDLWGHDRGDAVIMTLCSILKEQIRSSDILCRLGGDEFLIILPCCSLPEAERMWNRIEGKIRRHNNEAEDQRGRVSVSHGFAQYDPSNPVDLDDLVRMADRAMYRDKERFKARDPQ